MKQKVIEGLQASCEQRDIEWSDKVKKMGGNVCGDCGEFDPKFLESHHITPRYIAPKLAYDLKNGICICIWGHATLHKDNPVALCKILLRLCRILTKRLFNPLTPCQEALFGN